MTVFWYIFYILRCSPALIFSLLDFINYFSRCPNQNKGSCTQSLLSAKEQVMHVYSLIHLMDIQKIQALQLMETRKGNHPPRVFIKTEFIKVVTDFLSID